MIFSPDPMNHHLVASVELEQRRRLATRHRLARFVRRSGTDEPAG